MELEEIGRLRALLGTRRRVFRYFKDRYALLLLERALPRYPTVASIKRSPFAPLLQKPLVRRALAHAGNGRVTCGLLRAVVAGSPSAYRLGLGRWPLRDDGPAGRWAQATRERWNFVVQLNFDLSHAGRARRLLGDDGEIWSDEVHPMAAAPEMTLAWVRLDVDARRRSALIEEVQSDWVGEVRANPTSPHYDDDEQKSWRAYASGPFAAHARMWAEAALMAAVGLLHDELGITDFYYHTHRSGIVLKRMQGDEPPRSLYTQLPRRFCFRRIQGHPPFIQAEADSRLRKRLRLRGVEWLHLALPAHRGQRPL